MTERKRAENSLKISNENLQKSFKKLEELNQQLVVLNDEKNEFPGIAAHDLKNPFQLFLVYRRSFKWIPTRWPRPS